MRNKIPTCEGIKTRIKWMKASLEISKSRGHNYYLTVKGLWTAFWMSPKLEEESSVEEFKNTLKE